MKLVDRRTTKYVSAVKKYIEYSGHATNAAIVKALRINYHALSATTVHRITQRLYEDGQLRRGPKALDGSIRYDSNTDKHDHFMCNLCGNVRDVVIPQAFRSIIQCNLEDCMISGPLTVSGVCKKCSDKWKE